MSGAEGAVTADDDPLESVITYLEMRSPPAQPPRPAPRPHLEIRRAWRPTVSFYRYLYAAVGEPWSWTDRRRLNDGALAAILDDPRVEVNVLWCGGVPAGYAELDRRAPPDIELAYFGLMPEFIGQGLGGYLLEWAIHHAWRARPGRLWLHTCDLDHPQALDFYQRAGFRIYHRETTALDIPHGVAAPARALRTDILAPG